MIAKTTSTIWSQQPTPKSAKMPGTKSTNLQQAWIGMISTEKYTQTTAFLRVEMSTEIDQFGSMVKRNSTS
jgi:hypothetical protein